MLTVMLTVMLSDRDALDLHGRLAVAQQNLVG